MSVAKKVRESGFILSGLGVIGFIGIVWLMIYGTLDGNLGFDNNRLTTSYINETGYYINGTSTTLTNGASTTGFVSLAVNKAYNYTDGTLIGSGNYTVDSTAGTVVGSAGRTGNYTNVTVSYTVTYKSSGEIGADGVINNVSGGFVTFFGFSNTFFTIAAIVLLIFMLVGLLAIVMMIAKGQKKGSGYSGH